MSILQPYITALAERLVLPLETSPNGSFLARIAEKNMLITAPDGGDAILFYMEVGRPTMFLRGEVLTALMEGNRFLAETRGAALSYDPQNEMVGLNLLLPLRQLEAEEFINAVDNIVAAAAHWAERLETLNTEAGERAERINAALTGGDEETEPFSPETQVMLRA